MFFLIVGDGTEYSVVQEYIKKHNRNNIKLIRRLPKDDYDSMVGACDVGMIFLDHRFTIPNFPSRLLSYMQAKIPVIAATDVHTDVGTVVVNGGFGWWCESNDSLPFKRMINQVLKDNLTEKGINGFDYLKKNYTSELSFSIIVSHL